MERIENIVRGDMLFRLFGMELVHAEEGYARVRAEVKKEFLNAHQIAHGGLIFAILDVAFALAVNSITDAVGIQWSFNMFRACLLGDKLVAEARVIHKGKRSLVVEMHAANEHTGETLAQGMATALPLSRKKEDSEQ